MRFIKPGNAVALLRCETGTHHFQRRSCEYNVRANALMQRITLSAVTAPVRNTTQRFPKAVSDDARCFVVANARR